jgi:hypothetical protein
LALNKDVFIWLADRAEPVGPRRFDNRFLPTLYDFAREAEDLIPDFTLRGDYIMANLWILRIAVAPRRLSRKKPSKHFPDMTVREMGDLLESLFQYNRYVIYGQILELAEYELIWLSGYSQDSPAAVDRAMIRPMPKASWLLEFATSDVAFLNLAAMRCPFRGPTEKARGFLRAQSLPLNSRVTELESWIIREICNAMSMFRIAHHWQNRQRTKSQHLARYRWQDCAPRPLYAIRPRSASGGSSVAGN